MAKLIHISRFEVQQHTVESRLWELLTVVAHKNFDFEVKQFTEPSDVLKFFAAFRKDPAYIGFTIDPSWGEVLYDHVDKVELVISLPIIDIVYKKDGEGLVVGENIRPIATQKAIEMSGNLYKCKSVLIIGTNGTGLPLAYHFADNLGKKIYVYDQFIGDIPKDKQPDIVYLSLLDEVTTSQYDLIINTTNPSYYPEANEHVEVFTAPLDLDTLKRVTHAGTIVQETSCALGNTLLLQMARHLGLPVVFGELRLVLQAAEGLRRYFGTTLDENTIQLLVDEISTYTAEKKHAKLGARR
jgi:shikimate 5-dehydrogenase